MDSNSDTDIYGLVTELSKHILEKYRSPHQNAQFTHDYDYDAKKIKRLRTKAFEILLKKTNTSALSEGTKNTSKFTYIGLRLSCLFICPDDTKLEKRDPVVEIQKHAFTLKVGLRRSYDADTLEHLLHELEETTSLETPVSSVLLLLVQLKDFSVSPEPITVRLKLKCTYVTLRPLTCFIKNL